MEQKPPLWNRFRALVGGYATVFLFNFALIVLLLVAGRQMSNDLGMTSDTWGITLGIMLSALAIGSVIAERLTDRFNPLPFLAVLLIFAAFASLLILPLHAIALSWNLLNFNHELIGKLSHTFFVLLVPVIVLGTINPLILHQTLASSDSKCKTYGTILTWGMLGSMTGLYLYQSYLVFTLPANAIMIFCYVLLMLMGSIYLLMAIAAHLGRSNALFKTSTDEQINSGGMSMTDWFPAIFTVLIAFVYVTLLLCAIRITGGEFGNTAYILPLVAGILLTGAALGHYLGGIIAARSTSNRLLATLLLLTSASLLLTAPIVVYLQKLQNESLWAMQLTLPASITLLVCTAFLLPAVLLGVLMPVLTGQTMLSLKNKYKSIGNYYTWVSLGSLLAVVLTGTVLMIPQLQGPLPVYGVLAVLLTILALLIIPRNPIGYFCTLLAVFVMLTTASSHPTAVKLGERMLVRTQPVAHTLFDEQGKYAHIIVQEHPEMPEVREFYVNKLLKNIVNLNEPTTLVNSHEWIFDAVLRMSNNQKPSSALRTLILGSEGYSFPRYMEAKYPESHIEVVEKDTTITEAAYDALGLSRDTGLIIHSLDGRRHVANLYAALQAGKLTDRYDYLIGNTIIDIAVPRHLVTLEFLFMVHSLLEEDGVYLLNLVDMQSTGAFLGAAIHTVQQVFPHVQVFHSGKEDTARDTFVVVASKKRLNLSTLPEEIRKQYPFNGDRLSTDQIEHYIFRVNHILLTDAYAPVDNLLLPVALTMREEPAMIFWKRGWDFYELGDTAEAIRCFEMAVELEPVWPEAWLKLATVFTESEQFDNAVNAYRNALVGHPYPQQGHYALYEALERAERHEEADEAFEIAVAVDPASDRLLLNRASQAMLAGDMEAAQSFFERALEVQPGSHYTLYNLGMIMLHADRLEDAIGYWERALQVNPMHEDTLYNLALGYMYTQNHQGVLNAIEIMESQGYDVDAELLAVRREILDTQRQQLVDDDDNENEQESTGEVPEMDTNFSENIETDKPE